MVLRLREIEVQVGEELDVFRQEMFVPVSARSSCLHAPRQSRKKKFERTKVGVSGQGTIFLSLGPAKETWDSLRGLRPHRAGHKAIKAKMATDP